MKLRNLLIILAITFTGLGFSTCTDEAEDIIPQPVNTDETADTGGGSGDNSDID